MAELVVRCLDCVRDEAHLHLPLLWRVGTCSECAATSVLNHLVEHPGHRCEVIPSSSDESKTRSKDTQRLLGKAQGW